MARLPIDLTGRGGLVPAYQGDLNDSVAVPNLRYMGGDTQVADGIYDPLRVLGFMAPANNTFTDLTGTIDDAFISRAYSSSGDIVYLAQNGTRLSALDGLDDTSITSTVILPGTSVFKDLEMYEMTGTEALLYTYLYTDSTVGSASNLALGFKSIDNTKGAYQISSDVLGSLGSGTTAIQTITSDTNEALAQKFSTDDFFTLTSFPVSGVRVALQMPFVGTTQTWTLRIGIQTDSAGSPSGSFVSGGYVDIDPNNLPEGEFDYVFATFATPLSLTAGTTYHLVVMPVTFGDLGANEGVYWVSSYGNSSLYANGDAKRDDPIGGWNNVSLYSESFDFALITNTYNYVGEFEKTFTFDKDIASVSTDVENNYSASASTLSVTQATEDKPNPVIVAMVQVGNTTTITGVTCDGVAMSQKENATELQFGDRLAFFTITGISPGSHTITVTLGGTAQVTLLTAPYYGINQTDPIESINTYTSSNDNSIDGGVSISVAGQIPIAFAAHNGTNGGSSISAGNAQTQLRASNATYTFAKMFDAGGRQLTTGSYTMSFDSSGTPDWLVITAVLDVAVFEEDVVIEQPISEDDGTSFLQKADNGFMFWFTNNRVHKFDGGATGGPSGRLATDVLVFPKYITCIDAVDTNSVLYVAIQSTGIGTIPNNRTFNADTMGVYSWDRVSTATSTKNFTPIYGAREIRRIFVNGEGELRVITIGEDGFTELRGVVNGKLQVIRKLGKLAYPRYRDSLDVMNNLATWLGADGNIYALGKLPGASVENLYKVGSILGEVSGTLTSGIFLAGNEGASGTLQGAFISWSDSAKTLTKWYPHGVGTINSVAQLPNTGNVYTRSSQLPYMSNIGNIMITCVPGGAAEDTTVVATIKFYKNMESTPFATKTVKRKNLTKGYVSYALNKQYVNSFQMEIEWASQTLGTNDFMPAFAVLDYTATKTTPVSD